MQVLEERTQVALDFSYFNELKADVNGSSRAGAAFIGEPPAPSRQRGAAAAHGSADLPAFGPPCRAAVGAPCAPGAAGDPRRELRFGMRLAPLSLGCRREFHGLENSGEFHLFWFPRAG